MAAIRLPIKEATSQPQGVRTAVDRLFSDSMGKRGWMMNGLPGLGQDDGYMDYRLGDFTREKMVRLAGSYLGVEEDFFDEEFFTLAG